MALIPALRTGLIERALTWLIGIVLVSGLYILVGNSYGRGGVKCL